MGNYVVFGGSKGIGAAVVDILLEQGKAVINIARSGNEKANKNIEYDVLALSPSFELPESIDGLVYCPGSINLKPFARLSEEDFINDYKINVLGAIKAIQYALPALKKGASPSIVLFSTVAVQTGMGFHASVASAKGAIEGLTKSLAAEFAPTIRVNCIAPSLTNTSMAEKLLNTPEKLEASNKRHPLAKIGQPQDIAQMACFLLSEKTAWITGQIIHVDGGLGDLKV